MVFAVLGLVFVALAGPHVFAQEQITSYRSDITVNKDGSMQVLETIQVISANNQIRHGIYRDFPTRYKDRYGNNVVVGFDIQAITRDGSPEPYHFAGMENGVRIYIGDANTYVSTGAHTYAITYTTNRQLGLFKDHDELYWNVTGSGWIFPILQATAVVTLPAGVSLSDVKTDGWTGPQDSTAKNLVAYAQSPNRVVFQTTCALNSYEGLTIAVRWPKGFVDEPTQAMRLGWFLRDNKSSLVCLIGLIVVIWYFIWAQMKVGMDPRSGAIVPQWDPPDGLSPAAIRYVSRMGYDNKTLSCALINAAVKGYIEIKEEGGVYTITRKGTDKSALTPEELAAIDGMLGSNDSIVLEQSNNALFQAAIRSFTSSLRAHFGGAYFATHVGYAVLGTALSVLTLVAAFLADPVGSGAAPAGFMTIWLAIWTVGTAALVSKVVSSWRDVHNPKAGFSAGCLTLFTLPFIAAEVVVLCMLAGSTSIPILIAVFLLACANLIFFQLLRAYTKRGRQLVDKAEGLKLYMTVAEQERLDALNPPDRTPQLYEKLLPYALALGVEHQWSEQFADVLEKAQAEGYRPSWYVGPGFYIGGYTGFASSLGNSFSSAISSAATPPGSSGGGFGGGGGSGGGGGGGGGGGW